jgi:hypothetical protein
VLSSVAERIEAHVSNTVIDGGRRHYITGGDNKKTTHSDLLRYSTTLILPLPLFTIMNKARLLGFVLCAIGGLDTSSAASIQSSSLNLPDYASQYADKVRGFFKTSFDAYSYGFLKTPLLFAS